MFIKIFSTKAIVVVIVRIRGNLASKFPENPGRFISVLPITNRPDRTRLRILLAQGSQPRPVCVHFVHHILSPKRLQINLNLPKHPNPRVLQRRVQSETQLLEDRILRCKAWCDFRLSSSAPPYTLIEQRSNGHLGSPALHLNVPKLFAQQPAAPVNFGHFRIPLTDLQKSRDFRSEILDRWHLLRRLCHPLQHRLDD